MWNKPPSEMPREPKAWDPGQDDIDVSLQTEKTYPIDNPAAPVPASKTGGEGVLLDDRESSTSGNGVGTPLSLREETALAENDTPEDMVSVEAFANARGETPEKTIQLIRDGVYVGRVVDDCNLVRNETFR